MTGVALKGLLGRKLRAILTAFAIVLGVAMISGAFVLTDTLGKGFDVAEHHRSRRAQTMPMRLVHDLDPRLRAVLERAYRLLHPLRQNLRAAAGQRVEAGRFETAQRLGDSQARIAGDVVDLRR